MVGNDTYLFLMNFEATGGNILYAKALLFGLCLASVLGIASLGSLFSQKNGWTAGMLCFLSPIIVLEFTKFENDQFAYPILIWATYFLFKGAKENTLLWKKLLWQATAIAMVVCTAQLWGGAIYYLIAFATTAILPGLFAIKAVATNVTQIIQRATPFFPIYWENRPIIGFAYLFVLALGYAGVNWQLGPMLGFFTLLLLLNAKFMLHAVPLLAVAFALLLEKKKLKKHTGFFLMLSFVCATGWGIILQMQPPSQAQLDAIDYSISVAPGGRIQNDWELGYWVLWRGGKTNDKAGGPPELVFDLNGFILTKQKLRCKEIKRFDYLTLYEC